MASAKKKSRITVPKLAAMKAAGERISMLTAYDYPTAALLDEAGTDAILVGDSMSMVVQGHENTLPVTCLLYTSPSPRDQRGSRMPSSA